MPTTDYMVEDTKVPSVTTIIGRFSDKEGLISWAHFMGTRGQSYTKVRDDAGFAGTIAHALIEDVVEGKKPRYSLTKQNLVKRFECNDKNILTQAVTAYLSFLDWWEKNQSKIEIVDGTEVSMVSEEYLFGGTPDAVAYVDGVLTVLDWKTSSKIQPHYIMQLAAYSHLLNEVYSYDIDQGKILRFDKKSVKWQEKTFSREMLDEGWELFLRCRELYGMDDTLKSILKKG